MIAYRIKFEKGDDVKFISHLDVMRYFQRAIKRAELPIGYSQGFNPHQLMSFASPLTLVQQARVNMATLSLKRPFLLRR